MKKNTYFILGIILSLFCLSQGIAVPAKPGIRSDDFRFALKFPANAHPDAITGRVYIMLTRDGQREPRFQVRRARGIPFWGQNVENLRPGKTAFIDEESYGFPLRSISEIPPGEYYIQAFINIYTEFKRADGHTIWLHQDQWEGQNWLRSPGNLYSDVRKVKIDPNRPEI